MRSRILFFVVFFLTLNMAWSQIVITRPKTSAEKTQTTTRAVEKPKVRQQATSSTLTGTLKGHDWVDLGLPSGTKWATTNVGANSPSDYGDYFARGETRPKRDYTWTNLKYCLDSEGNEFSKYVTDSKYGSVDGKKELDLMDDAAFVNWGSGWRMPSKAQQEELKEKCKWTWTSMNGHNGFNVIGPNGKAIFLPASGSRDDIYHHGEKGILGEYSSRTIYYSNCSYFYCLVFVPSGAETGTGPRFFGQNVRPVLESE